MPLVTERNAVLDVYAEAASLGAALPAFCAEDLETAEGILASALEFGKRIGVEDLPIVPAWTCRYPAHPQMTYVAACGDPVLGTELMFANLQALMGPTSPYRKLRVMPHLDHAFPWLDADVLVDCADRFASTMCDASEKPFAENIAMTARYVEQVGDRVVVEGAVDEVFEHDGAEKNVPTTPEQAAQFMRETGVDLIVPNVGTEHRNTAGQVHYRRAEARAVRDVVGAVMCIHGTSSVVEEDLATLPADGFVKVNVYTTLAVHGGQAVSRQVLRELGKVCTADQINELIAAGFVHPDYAARHSVAARPELDYLTNAYRRDAWFAAVRDRCGFFLERFNYAAYAG
jgi:fructose-bisphosphate aldolase, class II